MSPQKLVFQPQLLPDGNIKVIKSYMEWLRLTVMEMETLGRYTVIRRFAEPDQPAFWIFQDDLVVRTILKMEEV